MGFQEENAGKIPSEILFEKTDILLTNDSLVPKPELQPSSPASRSLPGEKQKQREKLHKLYNNSLF